MTDELRQERQDQDEESDNPPKLSGAKRRPKKNQRDMNERVSLDPLDFEDAVKGMLEAKPPPD